MSGDTFLTVPEVAARLRISRTAVYQLCNTGELAHIRLRRAMRVTERSLDDFLKRHTVGQTGGKRKG